MASIKASTIWLLCLLISGILAESEQKASWSNPNSDSRIQNQGSNIANSNFNSGFSNNGNILIQMKQLLDELGKTVAVQELSKASEHNAEKASVNRKSSDAVWGSYYDGRIQNRGSNIIGSSFNTGFYNPEKILRQLRRLLKMLEKKIRQQGSKKGKSKPKNRAKKINTVEEVSEESDQSQEDTNPSLRIYPEEENFETDAFENYVY